MIYNVGNLLGNGKRVNKTQGKKNVITCNTSDTTKAYL